MTPFGETLTIFLETRKTNQKILSEKMGKHRTWISRIMNGRVKSSPHIALIKKITEILKLTDEETALLKFEACRSARIIEIPFGVNASNLRLVHRLVDEIKTGNSIAIRTIEAALEEATKH